MQGCSAAFCLWTHRSVEIIKCPNPWARGWLLSFLPQPVYPHVYTSEGSKSEVWIAAVCATPEPCIPSSGGGYFYNAEQEEQHLFQNVVIFGVERQQDENKGHWDSTRKPCKSVGGMTPVSLFKVFRAHNSKGISQGAIKQLLLPKCKTQGFKPRLCRVSLLVNSISPLISVSIRHLICY